MKIEQIATKALTQGKLLILLNGLDEVPTKNLNTVIDTIQDFVDSHDKNRFIVSCRTAFYKTSFTRFSDVEMADFNDYQIEQYINNWFNSERDKEEQTAANCWSLLEQWEYAAAKELAKTPLLLTFLCLVYDKSETFPNNRSILYRKALQILLEEWAAEKRIRRDKIYQGLNTGLEEILLAKIAYQGFEKDKLFYDRQGLIEQIKDFLASNLNAPKHLDGKKVLNAIEVQQGILVQRAENVYSFSHLTLQEYLTAQHIVDNNLIKYLVTHHLTDTRWREVFLLVAGLMRGGADELLLLMEKRAIAYLNNPIGKQKLVPILNWAENITTGSTVDLKPVAKRAIAIVIAYNDTGYYYNIYDVISAYVYDLANAISKATVVTVSGANYSYEAMSDILEYIHKLCKFPEAFQNIDLFQLIAKLKTLKTEIPDNNQPIETQIDFGFKIVQTLQSAFHVTPEIFSLSRKQAEELNNNYFYIYNLMLQCKTAALTINESTWNQIEDRMLLVPKH